MRFSKVLALVFSILAVRLASAADRAPSANPGSSSAFLVTPVNPPPASAEGAPAPGDPLVPPSLLPDEIPAPSARRAAGPKPTAPGKSASLKPQATAAEFDLRIRYRKARNVAERTAPVRAAWDDSREAKTDLRKRQALRRYYDVLFAQMVTVDRGITQLVKQRHQAENARLTQSHIAATVEVESE